MEVVYKNKFLKQLDKIKLQTTKDKLIQFIEQVKEAETITDLEKVKKMKGFDTAYRYKMGDYRVGFFYEDGVITFAAFMHRKEIYTFFP